MKTLLAAIGFSLASATSAFAGEFEFPSIDGGTLSLSDFKGGPVLVVNTASECGFTPQYAGMQSLYNQFKDEGLTVLAIPSDDFNQELANSAEVKEFCDAQFGLTFPMADITPVTGDNAHPFFAWLRDETGFVPRWNFYKVLLNSEGQVVDTYSSITKPDSKRMISDVTAVLAKG